MTQQQTFTIDAKYLRNAPFIDDRDDDADERWRAYTNGLVGAERYLVETTHLRGYGKDPHWFTLHDEPQRTNGAPHAAITFGWLGTTDNRSRFAHGLYAVTAADGTMLTLAALPATATERTTDER